MDTDIILRAPEPRDANLIYIWENSTDEAHTTLRTGPVSRWQIEQYIREYDSEIYSRGALRFMIETAGGETIGTIDVFDYDRRNRHAFVGIYIAPRYRRQGVGRHALVRVEHLMRRDVGMHSLAALVAEDNTASQRLFQSAGYREVGRLAGWLNVGNTPLDGLLYQHILSDKI